MNNLENTNNNMDNFIMNFTSKLSDSLMTEVSKGINNKFSLVNNSIKSLSTKMVDVDDSISNINDRMNNYEQEEEIKTEQVENITNSARKRVCEILGNDLYDNQKYFRIFIGRLYRDTRKNAGLGSKIARTHKRDYQRVIDYIEAWIPSCGCQYLKDYADKLAIARKKAKDNGYT